jgi:predicted Zn-dependent protease
MTARPDGETWVDGAVEGGFDIETIALHELGHLLGLKHSGVAGSVMLATVSANSTLRTLQPDDLSGIRALYPVP